jgi:hypothetical protein
VRQLGSKLLAGGLSAGVVLLWWPMFFPTDSVTTWLGRGIVWTLSFELLLVALSPFELALWSTHRGERISRRVESKRHLLDHESPKRRLGRRAGLALTALALPLALIGVGASEHIPAVQAAAAPKVTKVTRVVRVVKPVRVERVVKIKTVSAQVPAAQTVYPSPAAEVHNVAKTGSGSGSHKHTAAKKPAAAPVTPRAHANLPPSSQTAPTTETGDSNGSSQSQSVPPTPTSGATAQPTT